jgi:hypothetical protein
VLNSPDDAFWMAAVGHMASLHMDVAVIQTEAYLSLDGSRNAVLEARLRAVLDQSASEGIGVYLGLVLPEYCNGDPACADDTWPARSIHRRSERLL